MFRHFLFAAATLALTLPMAHADFVETDLASEALAPGSTFRLLKPLEIYAEKGWVIFQFGRPMQNGRELDRNFPYCSLELQNVDNFNRELEPSPDGALVVTYAADQPGFYGGGVNTYQPGFPGGGLNMIPNPYANLQLAGDDEGASFNVSGNSIFKRLSCHYSRHDLTVHAVRSALGDYFDVEPAKPVQVSLAAIVTAQTDPKSVTATTVVPPAPASAPVGNNQTQAN
jgi:hypothetical protein